MEIYQTEMNRGFRVLDGNQKSQVAVMVLEAGEKTGGSENAHINSDQWMYVVSGQGEATVNEQTVQMKTGSLLLIESGEMHEIRNTGDGPLETINFYVPPAY